MNYYLLESGIVEKRSKPPQGSLGIVPSNIDQSDYSYLTTEIVTDEHTGLPVTNIIVDEIAKGNAIQVETVAAEKTRLHTEYIADIDAEMTGIFGTTDRDEANALYNTYKEWKEDPSFFSSKGLVDENGSDLDTASKVSIYAQQKIDQCKDYSVFLIQRKKQFKDAIALLES